MALALGVSVAVATDPTITASSSDGASSNNFDLVWATDSSNVSKPSYNGSTNGIQANGSFSFYLENKDNAKRISFTNNANLGNSYKAQIYGYNALEINNQGNTIQMGDSGSGTLGIGGGNGTTVTLNFGTVTQSSQYAFKGNIAFGSWGTGIVNATLGGQGISGNLNFNGGTSNVTLKDGANINGQLNASGGTNTLVFEGSTRTYSGNASISGGTTTILGLESFTVNTSNKKLIDVGGGKNATVNFGNNTNNVANFTATFNTSATNGNTISINFNNTSNTFVGDILSSEGGGSGAPSTTLTFNGTSTNKLQGSLTAKGSNYGRNPVTTNNVVFASGSDNSIIGNLSGTRSDYSGGGTNNVTFSGTGSAKIEGNLDATNGQNIVVFNAGNTSSLIEGNVTSQHNYSSTPISSGNHITFSGSGTSEIRGALTNNNSISNFTFNGSGTQTITGDITTNNNLSTGFTATSTISFSGGNNASIIGNIESIWDGINAITFASDTNKIQGSVTATGGSNNITFSGTSNTVTETITANGGNNYIYANGATVLSGDLVANNKNNIITIADGQSVTIGGALSSDKSSSTNNKITFADSGDGSGTTLSIAGGIFAHWGNSQNNITLGEGTLTLTSGGFYTKDGTNRVSAKTIEINATSKVMPGNTDKNTGGHGIYNIGGSNIINAGSLTITSASGSAIKNNGGSATTTITAEEDMVLKGGSDVIATSDGTLNISAKNLTITRTTAGRSAIWSDEGSRINITIADTGSFSTFAGSGSSPAITDIALDRRTQFQMTFLGNATIKTNLTTANNSTTNQNIMNFGNETSSGAHTVTFNGALTNGNGVGIANVFNFNADNFTFVFKDGAGTSYQNITFGNTRDNTISFNANNGLFDLSDANALNITGKLIVNLALANSTNTITTSGIATSGTGTGIINFNADNANLVVSGITTTTTSNGTTINFNNANGTLQGSLATNTNSGANTTINLANNASGTITGDVTTSTGATNIVFKAPVVDESRASRTAPATTLTLQGATNQVSLVDVSSNAGLLQIGKASTDSITTINAINGDSLVVETVENSGGSTGTALTINNTGSNATIATLTLGATKNILNANGAGHTLTIGNNLEAEGSKTLNVNIADNATLISDLTNSGGTAILTFSDNSATNGGTFQGNVIGTNAIAIAVGESGKTNGAKGTITGNISGDENTLTFAGSSSELTLQGNDNTIKTLSANATINTLNITNGTTTVTEAITLGNVTNINLSDGVTLVNSTLTNNSTLNLKFLDVSETAVGGVFDGAIVGGTSNVAIIVGASNNAKGTIKGSISGDANTVTLSGANAELSLQGENNTIKTLTANASTANAFILDGSNNNVDATINDAISSSNPLTLKLISATDTVRATPTNTSLTLSNAVNSSNVNVIFEGGVADQLHFSTLTLSGTSNTLASVASNAKNAKILVDGTTTASITNTTISNGSSLIFAFTGAGASSVTATNPIIVGSGATLGISLGGSDAQTKSIGGSITFGKDSTLLIDFQNENQSNGSIGDGSPIVIEENRKSIINFHGTNSGQLNGSGITISGGNNTVNFIGTATMGGVTLSSGANTFNVYGASQQAQGIIGTLATNQVDLGSITNTINLEDYATFKVGNNGTDALATSGTNTINFNGVSSKLQGALNTSGTTTINIASEKSGTITGNIKGTGTTNVVFEAPASQPEVQARSARLATPATTLTLQGEDNTITSIDATTSGKIILDTTNNAVSTTISSAITGNNLTAQFNGTTSYASTLNLNGGSLAVEINSGAVDKNLLNLKSGTTTIVGGIDVGTDEGITISLDGSANGIVDGSITGDGSTKVVYGSTTGGKTLTLKGASNTITSVDANNIGSLVLGTTSGESSTTISQAIKGNGLSVTLNGASTKATTLMLNNVNNGTNTDSTIATLTLGDNSSDGTNAYNTLILTDGTATISDTNGVSVGANQGINFDFNGATTGLALHDGVNTTTLNNAGNVVLNFNNEDTTFGGAISTSGTTTINVGDGATGTIVGSIEGTGTTNVVFGTPTTQPEIQVRSVRLATPTTTLALQGNSNTITSVDANSAGTLILDATNDAVTTTISEITGNNLAVQFKGSENGASTLNLNGGSLAIDINSGNVDENLLNLQSGNTTIASGINVETGKGITIGLAESANLVSNLSNSSNLDLVFIGSNTLTGGIDTTSGTTNIDVRSGATGTITGEVKGAGATQATLGANSTLNLLSNATLSKITMNSTSTLDLSNAIGTHSVNNTSYSFAELDASGANVVLYSEANQAKARIDENGAQSSSKYYTLLKIGEKETDKGLVGDNTTFTLHLDNTKYDNVYLGGTLQQQGEVTDDVTTNQYGYTYSDRIIIENGSGNGTNGEITDIKLKIIPILNELGTIDYQGGGTENEGNIAVLTIKDGVTEKVESVQSVEVAGVQTQVNLSSATTDVAGNSTGGGYTTYFAGNAKVASISEGIKEIASTALTVNYDLYLANFNSINKRMGELRDNPHNQGVWARVYGGAMSNDFGAGSKTEYVTAQAGYDYSLSVGDNARNYMGIAIAYGHSGTQSNQIQNAVSNVGAGQATGLQDVNSNMVEVGIYNSYVMDSGWYNDTIFKFDYIMSSFTMTDNTSLESETSNFAMILSNEFGYRYKFGSDASWYVDPQVEVGFGYFNQSDFNRVIYDHINQQSADIKATQDTILTLRTRVGTSLGKKFNTDKGFASLYVGAFYEYDYIEGGNANASSLGVVNTIDSIESNGRAVLNVGSNIELTKGARLYIDVEKSFGDKQRTFMQFNLGARYSF